MSWFHPIEEQQVGAILGYHDVHPDARYLVEFADGESYVCEYFSSWESENSGELDIEMDDPQYDEFYQVGLDILKTVQTGPRRYENALALDYRDFPAKISDADTGTVIYPVVMH